jgi:hypothetical protein
MAKRDLPRRAYRQGELLFLPLSKADHAKLLQGRKDLSKLGWRQLDTNVLREGEATGHKHEVISRLATAAALLFAPPPVAGLPGMTRLTEQDRLLITEGPVEIVHPEHKPLRLPRGIHLVVVQREYDETRPRLVQD